MILYYVRHGHPIYDPDSLTELGHNQAKALSKRFTMYGLDAIYSSPSTRARQTAQPTCEALGLEMQICDWADEAVAWKYTTIVDKTGGRTWCFHDKDIMKKFREPEIWGLNQDWYKHPYFADIPFDEAIRRVNEGVDSLLLSLGYTHDRQKGCYQKVADSPKRVALFAHQGAGMLILSSLLDIPYPAFTTRFDFGHSSVTVISFGEDKDCNFPKVLQLSNDSHLYKENLLTGYQNWIDI